MRRTPREPEEGGGQARRELKPSLHRRVPIDPPQETAATASAEPTFSLNSRQLDLLKKRQGGGSATGSGSASGPTEKPPFVTRSNLNVPHNNTGTQQQQQQQPEKHPLAAYMEPEPVTNTSTLPNVARGTPTRTPNPASRIYGRQSQQLSDASGSRSNSKSNSNSSTGDPQRQFLRNMLQKAHSNSNTGSGSKHSSQSGPQQPGQQQQQQSGAVDQKALLRRVLAKTRAKKAANASPNTNASSTKPVAVKAMRGTPKKQLSPKRKKSQSSSSKKQPTVSASSSSSSASPPPPPPPGSRAAKVESHPVAMSLRDRMRRAKQGGGAVDSTATAATAVTEAPVAIATSASMPAFDRTAAPPVAAAQSMPDLPAPRELSWRKNRSPEALPAAASAPVSEAQGRPAVAGSKQDHYSSNVTTATDRHVTRVKMKPGSQRTATTTAVPATKNYAPEPQEEEEAPEGYHDFLQTLQTEVSGQHSELWSSFAALMQGREIPPVGNPVQLSKKRYKFDTVTKNKLTTMNLHLKKYSSAECATETQLVNDKRLAKEQQQQAKKQVGNDKRLAKKPVPSEKQLADDKRLAREQRPPLRTTGRVVEPEKNAPVHSNVAEPDEEKPPASTQADSTRDIRENPSDVNSDAILKMRSSGSLDVSKNPFVQHDAILQTRSSSSFAAHRKQETRLSGSFSTRQKEDVIIESRSSSDSLNQHRKMPALTDVMSSSTDDGQSTRGKQGVSPGGSDFETSSNPGLEVTLGQFQSKYSQPSPTDSQSSNVSATYSQSPVAWSGIRLRSTNSFNSSPEDSSSSVGTASTATAPPWAKMALRRVDRPKDLLLEEEEEEEKTDEIEHGNSDISDLSNLRRAAATVSTAPPLPKQASRMLPPAEPHAASLSKTVDGSQDDATRVRDKIDEAVVFELTWTENMKDTEKARVIVGKKVLMMVQSEEGESQAEVIWKIPREGIQSLTLDMASQHVRLILGEKKADKVLSFTSSVDCLGFANAFYGMTNDRPRGDVPSSIDAKDIDTVASSVRVTDDVSVSTESHRTEQLNDEEQALLDGYRRLRLTKPAEHALQESLSTGSIVQQKISQPSSLSAADEEIANKYRRMLKVSIPLDAVKHKMTGDGVDSKICSTVISEAEDRPPTFVGHDELPSSPLSTMSFSTSVAAMSSNEIEVAESYKKMLRVKVPEDAVRSKMEKENVDRKIIGHVLGDDNFAASESMSRAVLTVAEEKVASGYRKMLKMCIPREAVHHKMQHDEVPQKVIVAVLGQDTSKPEGLSNISDSNKDHSSISSKKISSLTDDEESLASQYRKMLKLQIPKDQVLQRMKKEGIEENIIVAVVGVKLQQSGAVETKDESKNGNKLVSLHWTPLSGKALDKSVWNANKKQNVASTQPEGSDISKLVALFQKKTNVNASKDKKSDESVISTAKAKLLDLTRSNNVSISLKAFREFSNKELREIIAFLDPTQKIGGDRVEFLRDLLPTPTEVKIIKAYDGSKDRLVPAETWFQEIADIKRIESKIDVMRAMELFVSEAEVLNEGFSLLIRVCSEVMNSNKLQDLLGRVLHIGNIMNEGTRTGGAAGFKFDSLLKLTQTKSSDGKMTVLDFLVTILVGKGQRDTLKLSLDFPDCQAASRTLITDLVSEVNSLTHYLKQCEDELQALKNEVFDRKTTQGLGTKANAETEGPKVERFTKRNQFLAAVGDGKSDKGSAQSPGSDEAKSALNQFQSDPSIETPKLKENSIQGGIERLEEFIREGKDIFAVLDSNRSEAVNACRDLAEYLGEGGGIGATSTLLGILAQFASNIETALKKYDDQQEAESRRQRKRGDASSAQEDDASKDASTTSRVLESEATGRSLVLLVNEMLKESNERTRNDYKKGRVYPDASSRMKAIYDIEKNVSVFGSPARRKLDIVSAIREREGKLDKESRSEFTRVMHHVNALPEKPKEKFYMAPKEMENKSLIGLHNETDLAVTSTLIAPGNAVANTVANAIKRFEVAESSPTNAEDSKHNLKALKPPRESSAMQDAEKLDSTQTQSVLLPLVDDQSKETQLDKVVSLIDPVRPVDLAVSAISVRTPDCTEGVMEEAASLDSSQTQSNVLRLVANQSEKVQIQDVAALDQAAKHVESTTTEIPVEPATVEAEELDSSHLLSIPLPSASCESMEAHTDKISASDGSAQPLIDPVRPVDLAVSAISVRTPDCTEAVMEEAASLDSSQTQSNVLRLVANQSEKVQIQEVAALDQAAKHVELTTTEIPVEPATVEDEELNSSHLISIPLPLASDESTEAHTDKISASDGSAQPLNSTITASLPTTPARTASVRREELKLDSTQDQPAVFQLDGKQIADEGVNQAAASTDFVQPVELTVPESTVKLPAEEGEKLESSPTFSTSLPAASNISAVVQQGQSTVSKEIDTASVSSRAPQVAEATTLVLARTPTLTASVQRETDKLDLAHSQPSLVPLTSNQTADKDTNKTATSIECMVPLERTVSEILVRTPPRKPPLPKAESTERKSLLGTAQEKRASRSLFFDASPTKPRVEVSPVPKDADAAHPIRVSFETFESESMKTAPLCDGPGPIIKSPGRKSLSDLAKERRASRSSLGGSPATKTQMLDDTRGTIVDTALLGQHSAGYQNTTDDSMDESAVLRLVRLEGEEKLKSEPPVQEQLKEEARNQSESTVARLARRKREEKTKSSSTSVQTPPSTECADALGSQITHEMELASRAPVASGPSADEVPQKNPGSAKKESAMVRMARMKREEKKATLD